MASTEQLHDLPVAAMPDHLAVNFRLHCSLVATQGLGTPIRFCLRSSKPDRCSMRPVKKSSTSREFSSTSLEVTRCFETSTLWSSQASLFMHCGAWWGGAYSKALKVHSSLALLLDVAFPQDSPWKPIGNIYQEHSKGLPGAQRKHRRRGAAQP